MPADPSQFMQLRCPLTSDRSRYGCKVVGECLCEMDDDLLDLFDRQQIWRSRPGQPLRWVPPTVNTEDTW